jgi:hypothetical protein
MRADVATGAGRLVAWLAEHYEWPPGECGEWTAAIEAIERGEHEGGLP